MAVASICRWPVRASRASGHGRLCAHFEHLGQARARFLVIVNRAAVERLRATGGFRQSAMKLELQNVRQEIARVGNVGRHVVFCSGVEVLLAARRGRGNALVLQSQGPPGLVVLLGRDLTGKDLPSPLIDEKSKGQEGDFFQRLLHEQAQILGGIGRLVEQPEFHQVFRRDGERDGVADGLVEAVIGAIAKQVRLMAIGPLIEVVPQFVMNGGEILGGDVDAHFHAQVLIQSPRARRWRGTPRRGRAAW